MSWRRLFLYFRSAELPARVYTKKKKENVLCDLNDLVEVGDFVGNMVSVNICCRLRGLDGDAYVAGGGVTVDLSVESKTTWSVT